MNRRAVAATLSVLALLGCARGRSAMPGMGPIEVPSAFTPIPRIQDTINAGLAPADPSARRATLDAAPPARRRRQAPPPPRPSPFTPPAPRGVAPRPIPVEPPPITADPAPGAAPRGEALPELPIPEGPPASAPKESPAPEPARPAPAEPLPPLGSLDPAPVDPALRKTARTVTMTTPEATAPRADPTRVQAAPRRGMPLTQIAATVGDEEITLTDLQAAVKEVIKARGIPAEQLNDPDLLNLLAKRTLDELIQRSLLIQAAKRKLKTDKNWAQMMKQFEIAWREHELPQLIQKHKVANEYELKQLLLKRGRSLDARREEFKLRTAATEFLRAEVIPKTKVDLPELHAYYEAHQHDFDRPARVTWREVAVEVGKHKGRAEARAKAEAALARLRRGEPFEKVARTDGEGPNAAKGGLWETTPGSYGIPAVNQALETLPLHQVGPILEGPDSFHIITVESRRAAGPATFAEVQTEIRDILREQKFERGVVSYFDKLRTRTLITSMFDGTASAPTLSNGDAPPTGPNGR